MSAETLSDRSAFECQCPRCNVTFPIETRKCLHCGGPTGPSGPASASWNSKSSGAFGRSGVFASHDSSGTVNDDPHRPDYSTAPIEPVPESPWSSGDSSFGDSLPNDRELETEDAPSSVGQSLLKSFGGVIWILLFIGFSIARSCAE